MPKVLNRDRKPECAQCKRYIEHVRSGHGVRWIRARVRLGELICDACWRL